MARIGGFQGAAQQHGRVVVSNDGQTKVTGWAGKALSVLTGKYRTENNKAKAAFVQSLKNSYGDAAARSAEQSLGMNDGRPLRTRDVRKLLDQHVAIHRQARPLQSAEVRLLLQGAGIAVEGGVNVRTETLATLAADVGKLKSTSPLLDNVVMTSDDGLRNVIAAALKLADPKAQAVTDILGAIRSGCPNRFTSDTELVVDGKTYKHPVVLAAGANGRATRYTADDNSTIVVKTSMYGEVAGFDEGVLADMRKEVATHRYAVGDGGEDAKHIAPLLAPVLTPNGNVAIVLKNCAFGDAKHMFAADGPGAKAVQSGDITAKAGKLAKARLAADIFKAMAFLQHKRNMIHLDLKPANLFVDRQGVVQVGDFGEGETKMTAGGKFAKGTPIYQAPEYVANPQNAEMKADSYSVGVMMLELFTGNQAFYDTPDATTWTAGPERTEWYKTHTGLAEGKYATGDADLDSLINGLTHRDPQQRWTFDQALKSPVLAGVFDEHGGDVKEVRDLVMMMGALKTLERERASTDDVAMQTRIDTTVAKIKGEMTDASNALG